jgi:hypothetical protein
MKLYCTVITLAVVEVSEYATAEEIQKAYNRLEHEDFTKPIVVVMNENNKEVTAF